MLSSPAWHYLLQSCRCQFDADVSLMPRVSYPEEPNVVAVSREGSDGKPAACQAHRHHPRREVGVFPVFIVEDPGDQLPAQPAGSILEDCEHGCLPP